MSIPKTIHYLWLSKEKPQNIVNCLNTWKENLKNYRIIEWNSDSFPYNDFLFTKEAYSVQKWAFVTDFFRFWVLKKFGGIYLDADIVVNSNFDSFLENKCFISSEFAHQLGPHAIGSEPEHPFISKCLDYFDNRHFIIDKINYDEIPLPIIITKIFIKMYNYSKKIISFNDNPLIFKDITIYNDTYFTINTFNGRNVCFHNYFASWVEGGQKFSLSNVAQNYFLKKFLSHDIFNFKKISNIVMLILPMFITSIIIRIKLNIKINKEFKKVNIKYL